MFFTEQILYYFIEYKRQLTTSVSYVNKWIMCNVDMGNLGLPVGVWPPNGGLVIQLYNAVA
jgi:hypothetical protein